ncbi:MAG: Na(+)/H(+) antiporter subunit B [Verrucomicrobiae bacterium]|nr:Na(+)/H(+) antiporter subunit B [Verrucomicrobiae bacterium]
MVRVAFFIINLLALYLLLRGHNYPGGGFIGGLAAAISLVLLSLALGLEEMHRVLRFDPVRLAAAGLLLATATGLLPVLAGRPFLEHFHAQWEHVPFLGKLHVGTPLLFDLGVFLVVVGVTTKIIFVLAKSTAGLRALVQDEEARYSSPRETPIEDAWTAADETAPAAPRKEDDDAN